MPPNKPLLPNANVDLSVCAFDNEQMCSQPPTMNNTKSLQNRMIVRTSRCVVQPLHVLEQAVQITGPRRRD